MLNILNLFANYLLLLNCYKIISLPFSLCLHSENIGSIPFYYLFNSAYKISHILLCSKCFLFRYFLQQFHISYFILFGNRKLQIDSKRAPINVFHQFSFLFYIFPNFCSISFLCESDLLIKSNKINVTMCNTHSSFATFLTCK